MQQRLAKAGALIAPSLVRIAMLGSSLLLSLVGGYLFLGFTGTDGLTTLDLARAALMVFTGFWLVWGACAAVLGTFVPGRARVEDSRQAPRGLTAILVPIYNEDPIATFSRVAAMNRSLVELGIAERFHIAILSDSTSLETAANEVLWFGQLLREPGAPDRVFYRRRERNIAKKAGNIEDFVVHSGGAYDYALILDADSLMEGATIGALARRMDADPTLGLLQTVPKVIHAHSLFGRVMQFSAGYLSPSFARGAALMQGKEGPYWGHNAIVRMRAFAASCGLPELSGPPPHGGHILSHDYVEAALLSRAGWTVKVDPTLEGSYEQGPENLIEYAKRDRRWCQGNLQHRRLINAPGLKLWSRFTFLQGIMAYAASPLWLLLLTISILGTIFPEQGRVTPYFSGPQTDIWMLGTGVAAILVGPKLLIFVRGIIDGNNRRAGGNLRALCSVISEVLFSTILAPVMLMLQTRAVLQVLLGLDGGWPATKRDQSWLTLHDAWAATWWITALGTLALLTTTIFASTTLIWVLPAMLPAVFSPALVAWTSRVRHRGQQPWLFTTESAWRPSPVIRNAQAIMASWTLQPTSLNAAPATLHNVNA